MPGMYQQQELEAHFNAIGRRMDHIEAQLSLIAKTAGVAYATYAESLNVSEDVVALARAGKPLEAVARYRELTGANLDQARDVVNGL
jgi:ribosomal protein L7/L12